MEFIHKVTKEKEGTYYTVGFAGAFYSAAFSLISQAIPFFVKYTLKKEGATTTIMLGTVLVVAVAGILIWSKIVKKWDIMKVWRTGFMIMAVSFIPLYFVNTLPAAIGIACVVGFGVAACLTTMDCIGAKIVDDDYRRHGIKRNEAIDELIKEKLITSTSVMAVAPLAGKCGALANSAVSVGAHFTLNSDSETDRWQSLTLSKSLGGESGMPQNMFYLTTHTTHFAVKKELVSQYDLQKYYIDCVDNCIDGVTEMFLHPAKPIDDKISPWTKRVYEYELLKSGDILQRARDRGVEVVTWEQAFN